MEVSFSPPKDLEADMLPHLARQMFVGYMCSQGSLALAEYAAFSACHSQAIQQSTYLDGKSQKIKQLKGVTFYQNKVAGGATHERIMISKEAEEDFEADSIPVVS